MAYYLFVFYLCRKINEKNYNSSLNFSLTQRNHSLFFSRRQSYAKYSILKLRTRPFTPKKNNN